MKKLIVKSYPLAYILRLLFTLTGVLFILFFTVRGIYQLVFTLVNYSSNISVIIRGCGSPENWHTIGAALKQSPGKAFDTVLFILSLFIFLHGVIGISYAVSTKYNRLKDSVLFYLQIISAIAVTFIILALLSPSKEASSHSGAFRLISILIAGFGSLHIGNGLYNACITLGVSVSKRAKSVVKAISWITALISFVQIIILFN